MNFKPGDKVVCVTPVAWNNCYQLVGEMPTPGHTYTVEDIGFGTRLGGSAKELALILKESKVILRENPGCKCGWGDASFKLVEPPPIPTEELPADMLKEALELINLY